MTSTRDPDEPAAWAEVPGGQGIQLGDHNVQKNTFIGQYVEKQVVQASSAPAAAPVVVGEVPQVPPGFQLREDLLAVLGKRGLGGPVLAVTGMRGVGKTQLAAAYARSRIGERWRLVAWVNAGDTAKVLNGLAPVAAGLGIDAPGEDLAAIGAAVRNWLAAEGQQCLVVFDNVTDLDGLRPFLPAEGDAQVVVTSTLQGASALGAAVPVNVFTEDEALAFLAGRTGRADSEGAAQVARELGFLPLALAQAGAVIAAQHLDYRTYMDRLRSLRVDDYLGHIEGEPYQQGVAEAVLLSLEASAAADNTGLCGAVMDRVSLLSTAGVPRALLHAAGQDGLLAGPKEKGSAVPPEVVDEVLGRLAGASLLTFSGDSATVSAHRLVMRVVRERLASGGLPAAAASTAELLRAVSSSLDPVWQYRPAARDLMQQIIALNEYLTPYLSGPGSELTGRLLSLRRWGLWCLNELGDSPAQAVQYGESLVPDCERVLGPDDPDTLTARSNLGYAYQAAGRIAEAVPLYERTLSDRERILDPDDPDTLSSRNNLAAAYQVAGRIAEAVPLYERTLSDRERVLGPDDPDTLTSRNNLAAAYQAAGRTDRAIPLLERTLTDSERLLGPDHPNTLRSRSNLAMAYQAAGRTAEAIPLLERTLSDRERLLGPDHPSTVGSRGNLAYTYQAAGRTAEAIPLFERTLTDSERVLGPDHPNTLTTRGNLALAYQAAGRTAEAIPLLERTLSDRERVLGPDHPNTLTTRGNLAMAYKSVKPSKQSPRRRSGRADG